MTSTTMDARKTAVPPSSTAPASPPAKAARWIDVPLNRAAVAVGGVALIGLLAWVIIISGRRKEDFASRALQQARAAAESNNLALASNELQKVMSTYGGTDAAKEAELTLNQVRMVNGQSELAAVGLRDFLKKNPEGQYKAPAYGLLGAALENSGHTLEAADAFSSASKAAEVDYLRADYLLDAGRAYASAGKVPQAADAFRAIIKDFEKTPAFTEAQVRLAELTQGRM
ncbi:MAG: tetratricopeptide repeat protein [Gemmatimonadota bacterium]